MSSMEREGFKAIYRGVLKIFEKVLKMENCPKIITVVVVRKNPILGIAIKLIDKTFSVPRNTFDVQFHIISKSFHQRSACFAVHLPLWCKKHGLRHFWDLFEIKHTDFFYSFILDRQYNIVWAIAISCFSRQF